MPKEPSMRAAIIALENEIRFFKAGFKEVPATLEEILNPIEYSVCVNSNNFFSAMNQKVMNALISAGIPQYFINFYTKFDLRPILIPKKDPKVFNVDDLMFGFIIWLVACGISITVFVMEVVFVFIRNCIGLIYLLP